MPALALEERIHASVVGIDDGDPPTKPTIPGRQQRQDQGGVLGEDHLRPLAPEYAQGAADSCGPAPQSWQRIMQLVQFRVQGHAQGPVAALPLPGEPDSFPHRFATRWLVDLPPSAATCPAGPARTGPAGTDSRRSPSIAASARLSVLSSEAFAATADGVSRKTPLVPRPAGLTALQQAMRTPW